MDVHYSKELPQTFVIGSSELEEVVALFEEHIGEVYIRVKCSDDLSRDFETVKELIAYRNPKSKEIQRIYLTAYSDDYSKSKSAAITFVDSLWSGILIDYKGPEDTVSRLKEETLDIIAGVRPWYNIMYNSKVSITIGFIFGMIIGLCIPSAFGYKIGEIGLINLLRDVMPIQLIAAIIFLALWWFLLKKPYEYLFPQAVFVIGQGKSRFEHQQRIRWCVIIGFFVSLAAGLVLLILSVIIT